MVIILLDFYYVLSHAVMKKRAGKMKPMTIANISHISLSYLMIRFIVKPTISIPTMISRTTHATGENTRRSVSSQMKMIVRYKSAIANNTIKAVLPTSLTMVNTKPRMATMS